MISLPHLGLTAKTAVDIHRTRVAPSGFFVANNGRAAIAAPGPDQDRQ
jgi:hypothetical protein